MKKRRAKDPAHRALLKRLESHFANDETQLTRRARGRNPRTQNMFVLYATRGKTVLKYIGGVRFASRGRAVLFPSKHDAQVAARDLKSRFAEALRGYTLRVHS